MAQEQKPKHKSGERIAKVIARAGLASRRETEAWIEAGRVAVNGALIHSPALDVTPNDRITVDGAPLPERDRTRLFLYHKPRGLMTTHTDPQGRPTIFERLPTDLPRLISIGRLDFTTEGLLLLTNDGALARLLELPATGWQRRYRVRAHGSITQDKLDALRKGVTIEGIHYGSIEALIDRVQGSNLWLTFAIREGKNREVRNVLGHLGLTVTRLIRVAFGPFQLGELDNAAVEEVPTEVLREQLGAKLVAAAKIDFSAPITVAAEPQRQDEERDTATVTPWRKKRPADAPRREKLRNEKAAPDQAKGRKSTHHAWRAPEPVGPGKKLYRGFHGPRRDAETKPRPGGNGRAERVTDRKGRAVAVERFGRPPAQPEHEERPQRNARGNSRRRSADRASGPRPRSPRKN